MNLRFAPVQGWLLLLPAVVLLVAFTHYPAVATFFHSFFSTPVGARPAVFVGLENYAVMLDDPVFLTSLWNSAIYALVTVPAAIVLALGLALIVNSGMRGKAWMRLSFFLPTMLPLIAVANIWLFFYTPDYGLLDQLRSLAGLTGKNWLGDPSTALACLMVLAVWKEAGFFMIFYLAALQQMDPALREAATLEGAGRWTFFRRVTWPLLMPTTLFVMINALINSFRLIDHVIVMTRGGPDNASNLLLHYIYNVGFKYWDTAYASALTVVLLALMAILAFVQFAWLDKKVHYQ
ncbi:carbohydrate ABC transporter membrane protein 1 (CUT1 family) [Kerstersia gyiorum]|uniref:Carbohydrate ABC transporter membrane protein 1 (CUT1 family) n=1 Tax=Kerstersia gyiorum TaxID=206506 RepID=A0A4Q7MW32_9BURK|nr:sugar ABC transporter permease [Kerstersia gyiorum]KAB0544013.1 sugar ABC transporter permease [Kerstersia gyiorum]RZS72983.1 carbohydrate ABC transporter membrane protein 1 (CUT1 family) [Kerstersia gyiorum]